MIALARYVLARCLVSQRWVPPIVLFALTVGVFSSAGGDAIGTGSIAALILFPATTWITISALHVDDISQITIVGVSHGSMVRARIATLLTSFGCSCSLAVLSVGSVIATDPAHGAAGGVGRTLTGLLLINGLSALSGVALGQACARPLIPRAGLSWTLAVGVTIGLIAIPKSPLILVLAALSGAGQTAPWSEALPPAGFLVVGDVLLLGLTLWAYRRRSP